jgi:putative FmdB family regulatory protein
MPLYGYLCEDCGAFQDWRPMAEAADAAACPRCGRGARRSVSMPFLPCVSRNTRLAHERNERSAEAPQVMRREELDARHGRIRPRQATRQDGPGGRGMYRSLHAHTR